MIILELVKHQDKFADSIRTTERPDGTLFEFLSSAGHVHGQYQIDNPISHPPKGTIGAIKEDGVWYWVIRKHETRSAYGGMTDEELMA